MYLFLAVLGLRCCVAFSSFSEPGLLYSCTVQASHCGGFSPCMAWALGHRASVVRLSGFSSTGSIVVAHRLSCSVACGIFLGQGSNPCLFHWQAESLPLSHQGSSMFFIFASPTQNSAQKCLLHGRQDIVLK